MVVYQCIVAEANTIAFFVDGSSMSNLQVRVAGLSPPIFAMPGEEHADCLLLGFPDVLHPEVMHERCMMGVAECISRLHARHIASPWEHKADTLAK